MLCFIQGMKISRLFAICFVQVVCNLILDEGLLQIFGNLGHISKVTIFGVKGAAYVF